MKTHSTAVVLIPSPEIWPPIQAIRRVHDRHFERWMPHITLLYPFRPYAEFDGVAPRFGTLCEGVEPFPLTLTEIHYFRHRSEQYTLWLAPEPKEALVSLQAELEAIIPECNDVSQHLQGFTPHLSIGQVTGTANMRELRKALQAAWQPLIFTAGDISLIWRREPPGDVFRIGQCLRLGRRALSSTRKEL